MNITATIEYLYRDGFTAKLNTSNIDIVNYASCGI